MNPYMQPDSSNTEINDGAAEQFSNVESAEIIVVDDNAMNLKFLCEMLRESGYQAKPARSGSLALQAAKRTPPDLFLLDINMPEMDGYELCSLIKQDERLAGIPVIFISASGETFDKLKAFSSGGVDYVTKPFQYEEVQARIKTHLELNRQKREIELLREQERTYFETISTTKNHVVQMASHDLKSPLAGIRLLISLLKRQVGDNSTALDYIDKIDRSSDRMLEIISTLLDLAKLETGLALDLQPVVLNPIVKHVAESFEPHAGAKNIHFEVTIQESEVNVFADRSHFRHVLENLISNAIRYTPDDGSVSVTMSAEDDMLNIEIADTGIGISEQVLPHIFERFYRVNDIDFDLEHAGSGLGLCIAKTIIEKHYGSIEVVSKQDEGSKFTVKLPILT